MQEVASSIGKDRRIGDKFLHPGPGYGGSCFPKDVAALIRTAREARTPLSLIEQVQRVNDERKIAMATRIERAAGGSVRRKTIAVRGVTFKPNTDDMRDAPSLVIVPTLIERGATVRVYDPKGRRHGEGLLPGAIWCANAPANDNVPPEKERLLFWAVVAAVMVLGLYFRREALRTGLRQLGYIEGKNIVIEFRWAETVDQLPELAAELVRMNVDVIFAMSSTMVARLCRSARTTSRSPPRRSTGPTRQPGWPMPAGRPAPDGQPSRSTRWPWPPPSR